MPVIIRRAETRDIPDLSYAYSQASGDILLMTKKL
jgi:hypothetical protein